MATRLTMDEYLDRALEVAEKEFPNSDPAEIVMMALRYRTRPAEASTARPAPTPATGG